MHLRLFLERMQRHAGRCVQTWDVSNGSLVSERYYKCCTYWSMSSLAVLANQAKSMDCFYRFKHWVFEVGRWKCYWNHQKAQNHLVWNQNGREYSWVFHSGHSNTFCNTSAWRWHTDLWKVFFSCTPSPVHEQPSLGMPMPSPLTKPISQLLYMVGIRGHQDLTININHCFSFKSSQAMEFIKWLYIPLLNEPLPTNPMESSSRSQCWTSAVPANWNMKRYKWEFSLPSPPVHRPSDKV